MQKASPYQFPPSRWLIGNQMKCMPDSRNSVGNSFIDTLEAFRIFYLESGWSSFLASILLLRSFQNLLFIPDNMSRCRSFCFNLKHSCPSALEILIYYFINNSFLLFVLFISVQASHQLDVRSFELFPFSSQFPSFLFFNFLLYIWEIFLSLFSAYSA